MVNPIFWIGMMIALTAAFVAAFPLNRWGPTLLFEERDGWRYQAIATNTTAGQLAFLEDTAPCPRQGRGPDPAPQGQRAWPVPFREFKINRAG